MCYGEYFPNPGPIAGTEKEYSALEHSRLKRARLRDRSPLRPKYWASASRPGRLRPDGELEVPRPQQPRLAAVFIGLTVGHPDCVGVGSFRHRHASIRLAISVHASLLSSPGWAKSPCRDGAAVSDHVHPAQPAPIIGAPSSAADCMLASWPPVCPNGSQESLRRRADDLRDPSPMDRIHFVIVSGVSFGAGRDGTTLARLEPGIISAVDRKSASCTTIRLRIWSIQTVLFASQGFSVSQEVAALLLLPFRRSGSSGAAARTQRSSPM